MQGSHQVGFDSTSEQDGAPLVIYLEKVEALERIFSDKTHHRIFYIYCKEYIIWTKLLDICQNI